VLWQTSREIEKKGNSANEKSFSIKRLIMKQIMIAF
jgi:hypothetical protein